MDSVHSLSLLTSLITGGAGAVLFVWMKARPVSGRRLSARLAPAAFVSFVTASLFGTISLLVHRFHGHGQESLAPMSTGVFFGYHRAYWLVLAFIVLAFGGWRLASDRQRRGPGADG